MVNGDKDYQEWKTTSAEFQGYMKATMESLHKKMDANDIKNDNQDKRINAVENRLTATEIKSGVFGTLGGIVSGILSSMFR